LYAVLVLVVMGMAGYTFYQNSQQQKRVRQLQSSLKRGDRVLTMGGIIGQVSRVTDQRVWVQVADGLELEMVRPGIRSRLEG
jgi:preprotein translocase subunit YajC